jgi:S-methylmethionine-dependent homocysteine/selenocysteine methylase
MDITLLDGGMGQELVHRAGDRPTPLWSTAVMMEQPDLVGQVHDDYFAAGATVATTNTYAVHRDRLIRAGNGLEGQFAGLHRVALDQALAARRRAGGGVNPALRIAGSIGPLVASYRPEVHPPHDVAVGLYAEVAGILAPDVDLILCETVSSVAHARAIVQGARGTGRPVWLSVTVDDRDGSRLRSGEPVAAVAALAKMEGAAALLANCSAPEAMAAALDGLAGSGLPFGAYANGFTQITAEFLKDSPTVADLHARPDLGPENYARFALTWVGMGATIIGGCCETGPAHIAACAAALRAAGHTIV